MDDTVGISPGLAGRLRASAILATLVLVTPPLMLLQWVLLKTSLGGARWLPWAFHRFVAGLIGMRVIIRGETPAPAPCLLACNHASWLDIVALSAVCPVSFIAKSEVAEWPIFGTFARLQRTIFVERRRRSSAPASRDQIRERLIENGDRLVLFPEGTSTDGMRVLPFKSALLGAADILIDGRPVAVQPVTIVYTGYRGLPMDRWLRPAYTWYGDMELAPHLWNALQLGPFEVVIHFHAAIDVQSVGGRKELARAAEHEVRAALVATLSGRLPANRPQGSGGTALDDRNSSVEMRQEQETAAMRNGPMEKLI